jgi:hypothetical protein
VRFLRTRDGRAHRFSDVVDRAGLEALERTFRKLELGSRSEAAALVWAAVEGAPAPVAQR